jgi:Na+/melibiose symporter-like transporter
MLTLLLVLAVLLAVFAAFAAFGVPYLVMGPRAFEEFGERADLQAMATMASLAAILVTALPFAATGLISAGPQMQVFAETVLGVPGRFWS